MRRHLILSATILLAPLAAAAAPPADPSAEIAAERAPEQTYLAARLGAAFPASRHLQDFDPGLALEVAWGRWLLPNVALELSAGRDVVSASSSDPHFGNATVQVASVPVLAALRGWVHPSEQIALFASAGTGVDFVSVHAEVAGASGTTDDTTLAFQLGVGFSAQVSPGVRLGAEAKQLFVTARFSSGPYVHVDTLVVTGGLSWAY